MKALADTIGVARSNLVEQLRQPERPRRGPYRRAEDDAVLAEIRAITDARPTYGYRRITALLNRARRSSGDSFEQLPVQALRDERAEEADEGGALGRGEPDLYRVEADALLARDACQRGGKVFLNASMAPPAWA